MEITQGKLIRSSIYWILAFAFIFFLQVQFKEEIRNFQIKLSQYWFDTFINDEYQALKRYVEIKPDGEGKINYNIARPVESDPSISEVKTVEINMVEGSITAFSVGLAFCIATPVRIIKKLKFTALGMIVLSGMTSFKYLVLIYDNYSHPEFILIEDLPFIMDEIVYAGSWFLSKTGSISFNVIFPVLIWILIVISDAEIRKTFSSN